MTVSHQTSGAVDDQQCPFDGGVFRDMLDLLDQPLGIGRHDRGFHSQQRNLFGSDRAAGMITLFRWFDVGKVLPIGGI